MAEPRGDFHDVDMEFGRPFDGNYSFYFEQSEDEDLPSERFGLTLALPFCAGLLCFGFTLSFLIIRCSRAQEKRKGSNGPAGNKEGVDQRSKSEEEKVICKMWNGVDSGITTFVEDSTTRTLMGAESGSSSMEPSEENEDETAVKSKDSALAVGSGSDDAIPQRQKTTHTEQQQPQTESTTSTSIIECMLCSQAFQQGQLVYESNNPQCSHQYHKTCMEKWLEYQNSCPTCNLPFVLHNV